MAKITNLDKDALISRIMDEGLVKLTLSKQISGNYIKSTLTPFTNGKEVKYQLASYTDKQVFHTNYDYSDAIIVLKELFGGSYLTLYAKSKMSEYQARLSKKGKLLYNIKHVKVDDLGVASHNREKAYLLKEGVFVPALYDLGVMDSYGKVLKHNYDKFKQINRFLEIVDKTITDNKPINIIDFGCGKSYLTFVVYHYLSKVRGIDVHITGLDLKSEVINNCNKLANKYDYTNLKFVNENIENYVPDSKVDLCICLHACDTATDYALFNAVKWNTAKILAVPCCQHEVNNMLTPKTLTALGEFGLFKERFSSILTDVIRAELLISKGYKVDVIEFVDMEHSPKNVMIKAVKGGSDDKCEAALRKIRALSDEFNVTTCLMRLFDDMNK